LDILDGSFSSREKENSDEHRKARFRSSVVELDDDYDYNVPPNWNTGDPVHVYFSVNLRNILQVQTSLNNYRL